MKIVIITPWHSEKMGYSDNFLPIALGKLGHEVYLISGNLQVYFDNPFYKQTYEPFLGPPIVETGTYKKNFYTLIRLASKRRKNGTLHLRGLTSTLLRLRPHIIQTYEIEIPLCLRIALVKLLLGCKVFTANHIHLSVFYSGYSGNYYIHRIKQLIREHIYLRLINWATTLHYPISTDCAEISKFHFKVPDNKIRIDPLGTDIELFHPPNTDASKELRDEIRKSFEFQKNDIICIYTGRVTKDKNPAILAQAIDRLHSMGNTNFKGLFIGLGDTETVNIIKKSKGCVTQTFVPTFDLPKFYWAADIAVWPLQESTSQLDAMACGLPLVLNDTIHVTERVDGNGYLYKKENVESLAEVLLKLEDGTKRSAFAQVGRKKTEMLYSWDIIAKKRIHDYKGLGS